MADTKSRQPRRQTSKDVNAYFWSLMDIIRKDDVPPWGDRGRDKALRAFFPYEPILAGAVATMSSKATALDWQLTGGRGRVRQFQQVLAEAEDGEGWSYWLDRLVQDYTVCDIGGISELGRDGNPGPVTGVYNLDAVAMHLTGNVEQPMTYYPRVGNTKGIPLAPGDFFRVVDMPSADEQKFGLGLSAVSRAYKAARVLLALYEYESEQLNDLPPQGIATITGMTMADVNAAFDLYEAKRHSREQMTFKGVLWMAAQANTMTPIDVNLTSFASLPDHFDKAEAIRIYVYTLALDFGLDVRELWPASQTGATMAEAEIQHQKAKGKGFGRMMSSIERAINWEILPSGIDFLFDQQDSQDDLLRYQVKQTAIEAVRRLWEPAPGGAEGILSTDEARRMLVEDGVLPDWLVDTAATVAHSTEEKEISRRVDRAELRPGEDLVVINRDGDINTVWSSRSVYTMPLPALATGSGAVWEVSASDPFEY